MKTFFLASAAFVLIASPALAQEANSGSNSGAVSGSVSGAYNGGSSANNGGVYAPTNANSASDSTANSGSVSVSESQGGNSDATSNATGGNATGGTSSATANPNANNQGNAQSITFNSTTPAKQQVKTNPTVYAPAMTTTLTETCMGSTSGGVSVMGFGGTLGTTWNDEQCVRRLNAREMAQTLGDRDAARALLCQDKNVAAAYAAIGQSCFLPVAQPRAETPPAQVQAHADPVPPTPPEPGRVAKPTGTMEPIPNPPEKGERG